MVALIYEDLTYKIIGAAKEVFKELGPGFLESAYEDAMCYELDILKISYLRQVDLDLKYKSKVFERKFRADLIVDNKVLVENKSQKKLNNQDEAQLINYLKVTNMRVGLLFNFGSSQLEIVRRVF